MKRLHIVLYVILLVAAVVWISFYGGPLPYLTFFVLLLILPMAFLYTLYVYSHIRIYQELPAHSIVKEEGIIYQLLLENAGLLPFVKITLDLEEELAELKDLKEKSFSLMPGQKVMYQKEMICHYAGTYYIGVLAFHIQDCFGLFSFTYVMPTKFRVTVKPKITDKANHLLEFQNEINNKELKNEQMLEDILSADLRKYVAGDNLKQVHWKNSAKKQELLVRKQEAAEMQSVVVVMCSENLPVQIEEIKQRDCFLELAVSIANYYCKQNKPVTFHYYKGKQVTKVVDSYETFLLFYNDISEGLSKEKQGNYDALEGENGICLVLREKMGTKMLSILGEEQFYGEC